MSYMGFLVYFNIKGRNYVFFGRKDPVFPKKSLLGKTFKPLWLFYIMDFRKLEGVSADGLPDNFPNTFILHRERTATFMRILYKDRRDNGTFYKLQIIDPRIDVEYWVVAHEREIEGVNAFVETERKNEIIYAELLAKLRKNYHISSGKKFLGYADRYCSYCLKPFKIKRSELRRTKGTFCSFVCWNKYFPRLKRTGFGIRIAPKVTFFCPICGKKFERLLSYVTLCKKRLNTRNFYCSRKCHGRGLSNA